jgi:probable non-F420 flavinoid oxidoreductase
MTIIGYHASHEQFAPSALLRYVQEAEEAGFAAASCSDHFHPWTTAQGQSGFAWAWLGAALQATRLPLSVVCAPGQRYHPAVIAQAAATLAEMFPGRFTLCIGSGELLNEHITGASWPLKSERNARLKEAAEVMRALWAGETVTHHGYFTVEDATLYTRPTRPPLLIGAAVTAATARWMGSWVDGLITVSAPPPRLRRVVAAFREGGGAGKPLFLKVQISYDTDEEAARRGAHEQWAANTFDSPILTDLASPAHFEALARFVQPSDMDGAVRISADPAQHVEWLSSDIELGFTSISLHNVNRAQERFIHDFGAYVLPALR